MAERKMTVAEIEAAMDRINAMDKKIDTFSEAKKKKKTEEVKENVFRKRARIIDEASR